MSGALHTAKDAQVFPCVLREVPPISGKTEQCMPTLWPGCGTGRSNQEDSKERPSSVSLCRGFRCLRPVDTLRCELVSSDGSSRVRGSVKRRDENRYDITYQPQLIGRHQLHILIDEWPILNSPFTVTILPNLTASANIIGDLKWSCGKAVREGGEVVVAERNGHCVSINDQC